MEGHSAAWRADFARSSRKSAARSRKPGLPGPSGRKTARSIPCASTFCRNSDRRFRNSTTCSVSPPKSSVLTDHAHSSAVGVRASPSSSIRGVYLRRAMIPYLTLVSFSQRDDSQTTVTVSKDTDVQTPVEWGKARHSDFAIGKSRIDDVGPYSPIQPYSFSKRQPMLGKVLRVLRFVPFEVHTAEPMRGVVNQPLPGGPA
jgi:hypothetical protein